MTRFTTSMVFLLLINAIVLPSSLACGQEVSVEMRTAAETVDPAAYVDTLVSTFREESPVASRLRRYHRDIRGRWVMPKVRNRPSASDNEPSVYIPLTLKTPDGEIQIELTVLVDGKPTPEVLAQLIQRAVTEAANPKPPQERSKTASGFPVLAEDRESSVDAPTETSSTADNEVDSEQVPSGQATSKETATETNVEPESESETPEGVQPTQYQRDTARAKLVRFLARSDDEEIDEEELEWMLDQWRPGPIWLIDRASVNPPQLPLESLAVYLDEDRDGSFSFQEIDALPSRFDRIDLDRDRIITQVEMDASANQIQQNNHLLAPRFDWNLAWTEDALNSKTESANTPRAKFIVSANIDGYGGKLSLTSADGAEAIRSQHHASIALTDSATPTTVTLSGYFDKALSENARVQTSIAATVSPNPIWSLVDTDGDGRLGEPERLSVAANLRALDSNGDKLVSAAEIPKHFAIVVCQGNAAVDKTNVAAAFPPHQSPESIDVPPWFRSMDTNQDNAISRKEFLGSGDAFEQHDQDNDGLMTAEELQLANKNDSQTEKEE